MLAEEDRGLRHEFDRLVGEGREVGELLEAAAENLSRGEALPSADLIERVGRLGRDWERLLTAAAQVSGEEGNNPTLPPDPATSLGDAVGFVESTLASYERRAGRESVLALISRITRLEAGDGPDVPGLAALRGEALDLARRISEAADPRSLPEFVAIAGGAHPYHQLLALVDAVDSPGADHIDLILECGPAFGREITTAAARGRLRTAMDGVAEAPEPLGGANLGTAPDSKSGQGHSEPPYAPPSEGDGPAVSSPGLQPTVEAPPGLGTMLRGPTARPRFGPPLPPEWLGPNLHTAVGSDGDKKSRPDPTSPITGSSLLGLRIIPGSAVVTDGEQEPFALDAGSAPAPEELSANEQPSTEKSPCGEADSSAPPGERLPIGPAADLVAAQPSTLLIEPAVRSDTGLVAPEPDAPDKPAPGDGLLSLVADAEEILSYCRRGDYLGASLLVAGRAFAGLPDGDPGIEALLVAHHAASGSSAAHWPDWCFEPAAAHETCECAPESARLVLLAALHQYTRGGGDPIPPLAKKALLTAFNNLPELRTWLDDVVNAVAIPGLWEQVCRPGVTLALDAYKGARASFLDRYDLGLQHRNPNAAYIHRQDHYMSRQDATRLLHDYLRPDEPGPLGDDARRRIESFLRTGPEVITEEWVRSLSRPTGGLQLKGNQRPTLIKRAAEYLDLMDRSWRAAEALRRSGPSPSEVEQRRERFLATLPVARQQSHGAAWEPLFASLTEVLRP